MSDDPTVEGVDPAVRERRRRRYKLAIFGPFVGAIVAMFVGIAAGYELVASVLYLAGIVVGSAVLAYVRFATPVMLGDERHLRLERRASHVTITTVGWIGLAVFPVLFVLDAAGRYEFAGVSEGVLFAFSAQFLLWGAVYTVIRLRS